jgi:hypothetical protein
MCGRASATIARHRGRLDYLRLKKLARDEGGSQGVSNFRPPEHFAPPHCYPQETVCRRHTICGTLNLRHINDDKVFDLDATIDDQFLGQYLAFLSISLHMVKSLI